MSWIVDENALKALRGEAADTVFSIGNGRFATRGTYADAYAGDAARRPYIATLPAGSFTRSGFGLDWPMGAPDWTPAHVMLPCGTVDGSRRQLDLAAGMLTHEWRIVCGDAVLVCREERFASWALPFLAGQRLTVTATGSTVSVQVALGVDGDIRGNPGKMFKPGSIPACDARGLRVTEIMECAVQDDLAMVVLKGLATANRTASRARIRQTSGPVLTREAAASATLAGCRFSGTVAAGETVVFEKLVAVSSDLPGYEDALDASGSLEVLHTQSFADAFARHRQVMDAFWDVADIRFTGDAFSTLAVRFAAWSTRIAAPLDGGRASIGPKNLTGDWYRGLLFWDMDIFQAPLLAALCPQRAENHVAYRARLLAGARALARQDGFEGARYPFSAPPDGVERPLALRGVKGQQLHVNLAAAWSALYTWRLTGQDAVMLEAGGLEVLLETARFWLSLIEEEADGQYHLRGVTGPDELHNNVDDNYYTNQLLAWLLQDTVATVQDLQDRAPEPAGRIAAWCKWTDAHEKRALDVAARMALPVLPDGTPAQFAGFETQPPPNCAIRNIWGAGDCTHKQADTVLLAQVDPVRTQPQWLEQVYAAYAPLCLQTSSLSPGSHALAAARIGRATDAERFFRLAATMELEDSFANTAHGIHGAGQGGLWIAAVHGFGGLHVGPDGIALNPALPPAWAGMEYAVHCHRGVLRVQVQQETLTVTWQHDRPLTLRIAGRHETFAPGQTRSFPCQPQWVPAKLKAVVFDLDGVPDTMLPALRELTEALKAQGVKRALVSDCCERKRTLEQAGMQDLFDVVIDRTMVTEAKPDPQSVTLAGMHCRVLPWECVGLAACTDGIDAIKRAGMVAVGVGPDGRRAYEHVDELEPLTVTRLEQAVERNADRLVNVFRDLNYAKLKTELAQG